MNNSNNSNNMQQNVVTEEKTKKEKRNKLSIIIKILIIILLLLLLFSLGILVIRLGNFLPNDVDIFFIEPKKADTEVSDDKVIWGMDTEVDIFRVSDINEKGEITVESSDGQNVIAPGMEGNYRFQIKNLGNIAVDLSTKLNVTFDTEKINVEYDKLPIELRFSNYKGEVLTGDWVSVDEFTECLDELTLGKNSYVYYNLAWRWCFETGDDNFDTLLGNLSNESDLELTVKIVSTATQSEDLDAIGGLIYGPGPRTGGDLVPLPYIILNLIILLIIIALIILEILKRRKKSKEIEEYVENIEIPTLPDPEPIEEPVVTPEPVEEVIPILEKVSKEEVNDLITDKQAYSNIKVVKRPVDKTNCAIINIDTIAAYFNAGEVVTLAEMKNRIPYFKKKVTYVKVLARGYLDKPLTIDADDFSVEAVKMILVTGGTVICGKVK